ncbi:OmpA family protein [Gordonia aquimaris]|uniref:OmpA family protein n=1 Tax=Gordonia aquimaris TaxID=2984863 RepID=A0A9X3D8G7_9ACTN|nr:OmpA family protein [Gordonia aquimaris]MCX2966848.1 OmpA family protein [Gordonia aquimaris]
MKRTSKMALGAAGGLVVAGVVAVGIHESGSSSPASPGAAGTVAADPAVAEALAAEQCSYMTKPGDENGTNTVVLVSRTGLMGGASLPTQLLDALGETSGGQDAPVGSLTLITVGGKNERPRVVLDGAALTDPKAGEKRAERLAAKLPACVTAALDATPGATEPGSDELLAQQVAAQAAQDRVVVVSDGEANTGLLDLRTQNYAHGDPADAVARVADVGQLPKFDGINVTYFGIGQNRTEAERTWLRNFYTEMCIAAGGSCTVAKDLVPVDTEARNVPADPPLEAVTAIAAGPKTVYRVDSAAFAANSTDLVDADAVVAALTSIAETAKNNRVQKITVGGHACDDTSPVSELVQISQQRADKIAGLLQQQGVAAAITATGFGAEQPVSGPEPDGTYTFAQCAANRRVEIVLG